MEVDRVEKGKGKQKGKGKSKSKGFSGGEWASSWLYGRGRGRGSSNKGNGKGKSKGKSKGKKGGSSKVAQKKRKVVEERLHTVNVQTAWSMAVGPRIVYTWSIKSRANKNQLPQTQLDPLLSLQPKLQAIQLEEEFSNLEAHLRVFHLPLLQQLHTCVWFWCKIWMKVGCKCPQMMEMVNW